MTTPEGKMPKGSIPENGDGNESNDVKAERLIAALTTALEQKISITDTEGSTYEGVVWEGWKAYCKKIQSEIDHLLQAAALASRGAGVDDPRLQEATIMEDHLKIVFPEWGPSKQYVPEGSLPTSHEALAYSNNVQRVGEHMFGAEKFPTFLTAKANFNAQFKEVCTLATREDVSPEVIAKVRRLGEKMETYWKDHNEEETREDTEE
jgi:hypothetical protein